MRKQPSPCSLRRCLLAPLRYRPFLGSVLGHGGVDLVGPGGDAAFDALEVLKASLAQELQRVQGAVAGPAVEEVVPAGVQLGILLGQRAEREQPRTLDASDLVFGRLAHVEDLDAEPGVVPTRWCC